MIALEKFKTACYVLMIVIGMSGVAFGIADLNAGSSTKNGYVSDSFRLLINRRSGFNGVSFVTKDDLASFELAIKNFDPDDDNEVKNLFSTQVSAMILGGSAVLFLTGGYLLMNEEI